MSHDNHEALPGYDPGQVYVDGCAECAGRARDTGYGLGMMDVPAFLAAWARADAWQRGRDISLRISHTEAPVLRVLWAVRYQLDHAGILGLAQ